jgi:hypothetical protein
MSRAMVREPVEPEMETRSAPFLEEAVAAVLAGDPCRGIEIAPKVYLRAFAIVDAFQEAAEELGVQPAPASISAQVAGRVRELLGDAA